MSTKKMKTAGALTRSETVTVRLDRRLRYLAELGARAEHRTLSSFIEWAVGEALKKVELVGSATTDRLSVLDADRLKSLYSPDEADRLVTLAHAYPHLLDHADSTVARLIDEIQTLAGLEAGNTPGEKVVRREFVREILPFLRYESEQGQRASEIWAKMKSDEGLVAALAWLPKPVQVGST